MKYENRNILEVESGLICHQVNAQGVMGTGIALSIKQKWPKVFDEYRNNLLWPRYKNLGKAQIINVSKDLNIVNLFGQFDFGRDFRRTEYGSLYRAMTDLKDQVSYPLFRNLPIYFPYKMGCNNAGGDWKIVEEMIDLVFPNAIICKI